MPDFDRALGRVFNDVAGVHDRVRPTYPDEMFADFVEVTGVTRQSSILEVGCGTGQATESLAAIGGSVTALERGAALADLARKRVRASRNVDIQTTTQPAGLHHQRSTRPGTCTLARALQHSPTPQRPRRPSSDQPHVTNLMAGYI